MIQLLDSPISDDHLLGALVLARLVTAGRLAPGRHRIAAAGSLAFTTAVRMVHRIHRHPAPVRANPFPTRSTRFTKRNVFVLDVADLADGRATLNRNAPHFPRRHTQLSVRAFRSEEHTSELQSRFGISYAVFCLKK